MLRFVTVFAAAVVVTLAGPVPHPYNVFKIDITPEEAQQYLNSPPFNQPQLSARTNVLPLVRYDSPQFRVADSGPTIGHYWKNGHEIQNVEDYVDEVYDASQFHGQDGLGAYAYGYKAPESSKVENRVRSGDVTGSYTYKDGNNNDIMVRYWADSEGFHQEDNLPKVELKPVEDTEEVKQARLAHQKAWQEAADAAALHPDTQPQQQPQQYGGGNYQYQASGSAPQAAYQHFSQPQQGYQAVPQTNNYQPAASEQHQVSVSAPKPLESLESQASQASQASQTNQPREGKAFSSAQASYQGQQISSHQNGQPQKYAQQGQYQQSQYQQNQYQSGQPQQTPVQQGSNNDGQYHSEEPEPTGPPRGFFYSFDYPVSIIVRKDAQNQGPKPVNPGTAIDHDTVGVDSRRYG